MAGTGHKAVLRCVARRLEFCFLRCRGVADELVIEMAVLRRFPADVFITPSLALPTVLPYRPLGIRRMMLVVVRASGESAVRPATPLMYTRGRHLGGGKAAERDKLRHASANKDDCCLGVWIQTSPDQAGTKVDPCWTARFECGSSGAGNDAICQASHACEPPVVL